MFYLYFQFHFNGQVTIIVYIYRVHRTRYDICIHCGISLHILMDPHFIQCYAQHSLRDKEQSEISRCFGRSEAHAIHPLTLRSTPSPCRGRRQAFGLRLLPHFFFPPPTPYKASNQKLPFLFCPLLLSPFLFSTSQSPFF